MGTSDVDAEEHVRSIDDRVSKGQLSSGKQMHFCTHHNRLNCKHTCRARVNEIGVKVLEEPGSHGRCSILEGCKHGLPSHVKERTNEALKSNEHVAQKLPYRKTQE